MQVGDGGGRVAFGRVAAIHGKDRFEVSVSDRINHPAPTPTITVVQALIKGERMDRALETLTEVGVDRVVPWCAANCVVRPDVRSGSGASAAADKFRRRTREAGKQARRAFECQVSPVADTAQVLALAQAADVALVLHEAADVPLADRGVLGGLAELSDRAGATSVVVVVGPEGGLTDEELAGLVEAGARVVRMGPTVLRASTAGTVAVGVIMAAAGRWS